MGLFKFSPSRMLPVWFSGKIPSNTWVLDHSNPPSWSKIMPQVKIALRSKTINRKNTIHTASFFPLDFIKSTVPVSKDIFILKKIKQIAKSAKLIVSTFWIWDNNELFDLNYSLYPVRLFLFRPFGAVFVMPDTVRHPIEENLDPGSSPGWQENNAQIEL